MRDAHSVVQIDLFYMLFIHSHIITLTLPPVKYSTGYEPGCNSHLNCDQILSQKVRTLSEEEKPAASPAQTIKSLILRQKTYISLFSL